MSLLPPLGQANPELRDALKRLSATKFGKPRAEVEQAFFKRMSVGDDMKKQKMEALKKAQEERMAAFRAGSPTGIGPNTSIPPTMPGQPPMAPQPAPMAPPQPPSFLDEWLAKRQQIIDEQKTASPAPAPAPATPAAPKQPATPTTASSDPAFGPTARLDTRPPQSQHSPQPIPKVQEAPKPQPAPAQPAPATQAPVEPEKLHIRDTSANASDDGVSVKLR
jgi:hypothetical protein